MAGCKPAWCACQLGHRLQMFLQVYSKWMPSEDKRGVELAKEEGNVPDTFHDVTPETKNPLVAKGLDGRRDWTRTNDPHHVKVVL